MKNGAIPEMSVLVMRVSTADIRELELRIDTIDPAYYTVAHGDGQTTAPAEAGVDVGGHARSAAECGTPVLRATESDSGQGGLRRPCRVALSRLLRRRGRASGAAAGSLFSHAAGSGRARARTTTGRIRTIPTPRSPR